MHIKPFIDAYLHQAEVMQLATAANNQPWACTVHFVYTPDSYKIYWVSDASRRHSQEVAANPRVAAAIAISTNQPVIGVQIEGDAVCVTDTAEREVGARLFAKRHGSGEEFIQAVMSGKKPLYCLTPRLLAIFDKKNFPDDPKQEWHLKA